MLSYAMLCNDRCLFVINECHGQLDAKNPFGNDSYIYFIIILIEVFMDD